MWQKMGKVFFPERKISPLFTADLIVNSTLTNGGKYYGETGNTE